MRRLGRFEDIKEESYIQKNERQINKHPTFKVKGLQKELKSKKVKYVESNVPKKKGGGRIINSRATLHLNPS